MDEEVKKSIKFYQLPNDTCSCRDENGDTVKIGKRYREYYEKLSTGMKSEQALEEMNVKRTCCRLKFLCLSTDVMIDRSKERFVDNTVFPNVIVHTRDLYPINPPPDFPAL